MKKIVVITVLALLLTGCSKTTRNVKLTVINNSASTVTDINAVGVDFSVSIGILQSGEETTVTHLRPSDGAGFSLDYDADGKHFSELITDDPWNGFKEIIVTIAPDFSMDYGQRHELLKILQFMGRLPMKIKMILPALTEANSPFFRPIKYSLFPPLGLASLAAYASDEDQIE